MTRNQSLFFRCLLFLAGAGLIVLAFFLFKGEREPGGKDVFVWVSIGLMYLVFFLPFFFSAVRTGNFSGKIPSLTLVWTGILLYTGASIGVILLLATVKIITINIAIIIQAVLLFLFFIVVYFAYFASSHVQKVGAQEAVKQQYINQLKPKAQSLLLTVDRLPAGHEKAQKILKQAIEEIRYIYPVDSGAGDELELRIIQSLNIISEICGGTGASPASLESEAERLSMLVKERKLLRN
jgi:hypothetical protein